MEIQFCPLYSGSNGNALYVGGDTTRLLVDAGVSGSKISKGLQGLGVDPASLQGILITHEHSDHIAGAGVLSRKYNLPIYASEGTWAAMEEKLGGIEGKNRRIFDVGTDFCIGDIQVETFATPHDSADPVGYSLFAGGIKLMIATDLGVIRDSWLSRGEGADLVLLESNHDVNMVKVSRYPYELKRRILGNKGHLSNDMAGQAALELYKRGVRSMILGHLSGENNFPELAYETVALALREGGVEPNKDMLLDIARRDGGNKLYRLTRGGWPTVL